MVKQEEVLAKRYFIILKISHTTLEEIFRLSHLL